MDDYENRFLKRGLATLAFDGPGQGEAEYDFAICPEYEKPVKAVIDYLETRNDSDHPQEKNHSRLKRRKIM